MYNVKLLNKIAKVGTDNLDAKTYNIGEDVENPEDTEPEDIGKPEDTTPDESESETKKPSKETEEDVDDEETEGEEEGEDEEYTEEGGCGSVISGAAIALTAVLALGAGMVFKKKED